MNRHDSIIARHKMTKLVRNLIVEVNGKRSGFGHRIDSVRFALFPIPRNC